MDVHKWYITYEIQTSLGKIKGGIFEFVAKKCINEKSYKKIIDHIINEMRQNEYYNDEIPLIIGIFYCGKVKINKINDKWEEIEN